MSESQLIGTAELAKMWHLSEGTIRNWRSQEKGPDYIKLNGKVLYDIDDVREFGKGMKKIMRRQKQDSTT